MAEIRPTAATQSALNSALMLAGPGGAVNIGDLVIDVNTDLTIPQGVALIRDNPHVGTQNTGVNQNTAAILNQKGQLRLNPNAKIRLGAGSYTNVLVTRAGLSTLPVTSLAGFLGLCYSLEGDDIKVEGMVLGFAKALESVGHHRMTIENFRFDCLNGIDISQCLDVPRLNKVHAWPFCTVNGWGGAPLIRPGKAFRFHNTADHVQMSDCFSYGYDQGLELNNANGAVISNCGFDNKSHEGGAAPLGVLIKGACDMISLINVLTYGHKHAGIQTELTSGQVKIQGGADGGPIAHGVIAAGGGKTTVLGRTFHGVSNGITRANQAAIVQSDMNTFDGVGQQHNPYVPSTPANFYIGPGNR